VSVRRVRCRKPCLPPWVMHVGQRVEGDPIVHTGVVGEGGRTAAAACGCAGGIANGRGNGDVSSPPPEAFGSWTGKNIDVRCGDHDDVAASLRAQA